MDTSVFYAAVDRGDRSFERASAVLRREASLVTSDHVVVETWILLRSRLGRQIAEQWWSALRSSGCRVESITEADMGQAWALGETFADQDFSIVDRSSFALMVRLGLNRVASLDDDFSIFRYGPRRERAFEVLR